MTNLKGYATGDIYWIYPIDKAPPKGVKLALLTIGGIQVEGFWTDDKRYIAWQYLFKRDKEKEKQCL